MKASALMASNELNFNSILELSRFMIALRYLGSELNQDDIWFLANTAGCGSIEEEDAKDGGDEKVKTRFISFQAFLRSLRKSLPEVNELF
jgi:hypothetical protein